MKFDSKDLVNLALDRDPKLKQINQVALDLNKEKEYWVAISPNWNSNKEPFKIHKAYTHSIEHTTYEIFHLKFEDGKWLDVNY